MTAAVRVNECQVLFTGCGADWWMSYRYGRGTNPVWDARFHHQPSLGGDMVWVQCDSHDDATDLAAHMVGAGGLPKTAVKVTTFPAPVARHSVDPGTDAAPSTSGTVQS